MQFKFSITSLFNWYIMNFIVFYFLNFLQVIYHIWKQTSIRCVKYYGNKNKKCLEPDVLVPKSVNYHFTRKCNYECGFCFHTAKTSAMLNLEHAKKGLLMLKLAGTYE